MHVDIQFFQHLLLQRLSLLHYRASASLSKANEPYISKRFSLVSVACSLGLYICPCYRYPIDFTITLQQVLKSGSVLQLLFLSFKIILALWSPWRYCVNFRMRFSISAKNAVGILIEVALNL